MKEESKKDRLLRLCFTFLRVHMYVYVCTNICTQVGRYACVYVCMYVCLCGWMDGCIYVCVFVDMYLCTCVCKRLNIDVWMLWGVVI